METGRGYLAVIVDESQNIKEASSQRTKVVVGICKAMAKRADVSARPENEKPKVPPPNKEGSDEKINEAIQKMRQERSGGKEEFYEKQAELRGQLDVITDKINGLTESKEAINAAINAAIAQLRDDEKKIQDQMTELSEARKAQLGTIEASFRPRTEAEVNRCVDKWMTVMHPRGREFFEDDKKLRSILRTVATSTAKTSDPILQQTCCLWHGDVKAAKDTKHAAIQLTGPGEEGAPCVTYTSRVLIFLFATDEQLARWMRLPKQPLKMRCNIQRCVSLACILEECDLT